MRILVTGAFGNVGRSTVASLLDRGHQVRVLEKENPKNRRSARKLDEAVDVRLGDILNVGDVMNALDAVDAVIHLAAVIPPAADRFPDAARMVNIEGTRNLIYCMENSIENGKPALGKKPRLVFASSIAIYGDRRSNPLISTEDGLYPNPADHYASHKIACEGIIRKSSLDWTILRLSYIADPFRLQLDPLMFEMPLETSLEICDTRDAGEAFAEAAGSGSISGKTLNIAGGAECRTTYLGYLQNMLKLMGLGNTPVPESAFSQEAFHCGFMDTRESEALLQFQNRSLDDFYSEVKKMYASKRFFIKIMRNIANKILYLKSPHFTHALKQQVGAGQSKGAVYIKFLLRHKSALT